MTMLISIDTTPNPNSMKLNLSDTLPQSGTFTLGNEAASPEVVQQLLRIDGVQSIFVSACFLTINRDPRIDWEAILQAARSVFTNNDEQTPSEEQAHSTDTYGQIQVLVQIFRNIPIQIKVTDGKTEKRVGLPARFGELARELQEHFRADYLKERHWSDYGVRYGILDDVAQEVAEEIEALLDVDTLDQRKLLAISNSASQTKIKIQAPQPQRSQNTEPDWHERFRAVQEIEASEETFSFLLEALWDSQPQVRRWAAAKLAAIKTPQSVEALSQCLLSDSNVGVRRTAGDSLSDIGDVAAQEVMCKALDDKNKLVRWRAARFLAEVGTEAALPSLEAVKNDLEYEVRLEVEAAIQHIREGSKASLPVWKLMSQET
jgi:hypothetical protein